jgi:hypothetical protein
MSARVASPPTTDALRVTVTYGTRRIRSTHCVLKDIIAVVEVIEVIAGSSWSFFRRAARTRRNTTCSREPHQVQNEGISD